MQPNATAIDPNACSTGATARAAWPRALVIAALGLLALPQAFACFTVYNRSNQVVYNAQTPPVDMRYQIHEVLPAVYPGGHMVFSNDDLSTCPYENRVAVVAVQPVAAVAVRGGAYGGLRPKPDRN